jgi:hypothetical protein
VVAKACRTALLRTRSLPRAVRGPVLRLAFFRLAASLRSEVISRRARRTEEVGLLSVEPRAQRTSVTGMRSPGEKPLRLNLWLFGRVRHLGGNSTFSGQAFGQERRCLGAREREQRLDDCHGGNCRFARLNSRAIQARAARQQRSPPCPPSPSARFNSAFGCRGGIIHPTRALDIAIWVCSAKTIVKVVK